MPKYSVNITSDPNAKVVSFDVWQKKTDYYGGRKVGTRHVKVGTGTVIGGRGSYGHGNMAGWTFQVEKATVTRILNALTDKTADFYLR